jgi:hypothetical protein
MLTVIGLLVYNVIQRQVRLSLRTQDQQLAGNTGETATPTAAVVLALFAPVAMVHRRLGSVEMRQVYGVNADHLMVWEAQHQPNCPRLSTGPPGSRRLASIEPLLGV